jgi:hypothetical protein
MACITVSVSSPFPQDTTIFHDALRNWQLRNRDSRNWEQLSQAEQSAIMRDAQSLKVNGSKPLTIEAVLEGSRRSLDRFSFRRTIMRTLAIVALAALVATTALAQNQAPSMTVFGLELGAPFTVPECSLLKLGRKDYIYAENDKTVCYELNFVHSKTDPRSTMPVTDGSVKLRFPLDQAVIGTSMSAGIVKGNLEAIDIGTLGISDQDVILNVLEKKYGTPPSLTAGSVQNAMGAQFSTILAVWHFSEPDLTIVYKSVDQRIDRGSISIQTRASIMSRASNLREPKL